MTEPVAYGAARLQVGMSIGIALYPDHADSSDGLIERADQPGYWQSVTGSLDRDDEPLESTAWREVAARCGLGSSIAVPLMPDAQSCFGALCIYAADPLAFDDEELRLLAELDKVQGKTK